MTRAQFLQATAAGLTAATLSGTARAADEALPTPPICVFSKHLQYLDYPELARTCKALGLDGVDLTVRRGGHVLPENVATDLPLAVEAIRAEGLSVPMITTRLESGREAEAAATLEEASKLGIRYFRVGGQKYNDDQPIPEQIETFTEEVRNLSEVAAKYDMVAGFHNHSGYDYVGAPVWDLYQMIQGTNMAHFGSNFDIGHATVEGGYGAWKTHAMLLGPHMKMMAVKDFRWDKDRPRWVPLGEGVVKIREMLRIAHDASFAGPISIHIEYGTASNEILEEHIADAAKLLRKELKMAGWRG
jgi:sugar phosphate isomerase/epimerase